MRSLEKYNEETQKNHKAFGVRVGRKSEAKEKERSYITKPRKVGEMYP